MKKTISVFLAALFAVSVLLFCAISVPELTLPVPVTVEASAVSVGQTVSDGVVVDSNQSFCGCCHSHNHGSGIGDRIFCLFCRLKQMIQKLIGRGETNVQHKYQVTSDRAATCSAEGRTDLRCGVCGKTTAVTSPKLEHRPTAVAAKAATCTATGLTAGTKCAVCGAWLQPQNVTPALGHSYSDTVVAPDCTARGYTVHTCVRCGVSYTDAYVNALGHAFGNWTVTAAPTCTAAGTEKRTCTRCSAAETRSVQATGHTESAAVEENRVEPTCMLTGSYQSVVYCAACHAELSRTAQPIPALGHDFGDWTETTAPTCTAAGVETRTCSRCDAAETRNVAALGHDYASAVTDPTCTAAGYTTYTCTRCGDEYTDNETPAMGHDFGAWAETIAPTCTAAGEEARECSRCDAVQTRITAALGHDYASVITDPTCTAAGYTTFTCIRCGDQYTGDETPAQGHDFGEWAETTAPTCTETGVETRACSRCDASETREIAALGHTYVVQSTTASCTEGGQTTYVCSVCSDTYTETTALPLGHDFTDGDTVTGFAVTASGVTANYTCSRCGTYVSNAEIPAVASVNGYTKVYHTLNAAVSAEGAENVFLLRDYTQETDLTVPAGVTLVIPCKADDTGYAEHTGNDDGSYPLYCADNPGTTVAPSKFRELTVPQNVTVTVNGTLLVNAVTGVFGAGQDNYGITGGFGAITLGGDINVLSGGVLDCSGYVYNDGGEVTVANGGRLFETFGALRWRGGSYAYAAMFNNYNLDTRIYPIENYDLNFMRAKLTLEYGSSYAATVKMAATAPGSSLQYYYCHFPQINSSSNALFLLSNGAYCERTVNGAGRTFYKFYGNVTMSFTKLKIMEHSISTADAYYKFDGNTQVEFYNGRITSTRYYHFLPGFKMVVGDGAWFDVSGGSGLLFSTAGDYTVDGTAYYGYYSLDQQFDSPGKWYTQGRDDAALYILGTGSVSIKGLNGSDQYATNRASIAGRVYVGPQAYLGLGDTNTFSTITRNVACGAVNGSGASATINVNTYVTVLQQLNMDAAAEAAAKAALGLE